MTYFWWILGIYWVLCSAVILITDIRDLGLEEEGFFDNLIYYGLLTPLIILGELAVDIIHFFKRRLQ
ncbi:MAG: hypothetical protein RBS24_06825 [Bacilli bacterium]|nr:hypothetical protein [Bacilli bacterium]